MSTLARSFYTRMVWTSFDGFYIALVPVVWLLYSLLLESYCRRATTRPRAALSIHRQLNNWLKSEKVKKDCFIKEHVLNDLFLIDLQEQGRTSPRHSPFTLEMLERLKDALSLVNRSTRFFTQLLHLMSQTGFPGKL